MGEKAVLESTNAGRSTEDLVESICTKIFFSDFTVKNPKYKKENGAEREAADILIPYKETLLAFQIKAKIEKKNADQKTSVDFDRIERKVQEGIDQLQEIKKAVSNKNLCELTTSKGITIPFTCDHDKKIIGVVILDLVGEDRFPRDSRTSMFNGFTIKHGMPIHLFMREDFEEISKELDTLPDFLKYIGIREALRTRNALSPMTDELDFLGLYKSNWPMIEELLSGKYDLLVLAPDIWEGYKSRQNDIRERDRKNLPSYLVDEMISRFYLAIDFDPGVDIPGVRKSAYIQGSVDNYMRSITELASLSRLQRRAVGEALLEKAKKADAYGMGYRLILDRDNKSAILVMAFDGDRKDRVDRLYQLCSVAYCKHDLTKIMGIATEPAKESARSEDVVILDGVGFTNKKELLESAQNLFGKEAHFRVTEY